MALFSEYTELDEAAGQFRQTLYLKPIAFRRNGDLRRMVQDFADSGDPAAPHHVEEAPLWVSVSNDGTRRVYPTRQVDRYLEIGAPLVKVGGVWTRLELGRLARNGHVLTWTGSQTITTIVHGGHYAKLNLELRDGFVPEDAQLAFPIRLWGLTRRGLSIWAEGRPVAFLPPFVVEDAANPVDVRPIAHQFVYLGRQSHLLLTLPDLTGMIRPVVDPTLNLQPDNTAGKDARIQSSGGSNRNHGINPQLTTGESATFLSHTFRSLIQFDLSSIPPTAAVQEATLSLYQTSEDSSTTTELLVRRLKRIWVEGTRNDAEDNPATGVTWNRYDTSNLWQIPGAAGDDDRDQTILSTFPLPANPTINEFKNISIPTGVIEDWISGAFANNGLMLSQAIEGNAQNNFASSDNATAANRPKLSVTYLLPGGGRGIGRGIMRGALRGVR